MEQSQKADIDSLREILGKSCVYLGLDAFRSLAGAIETTSTTMPIWRYLIAANAEMEERWNLPVLNQVIRWHAGLVA